MGVVYCPRMGKQTNAWYVWLDAAEMLEVMGLDAAIHEREDELLVLKARREVFMRRAQTRKQRESRSLVS